MSQKSKILGQTGESLAATLLERKHYQIIARNYRSRFGEVDILARDGKELVVVEVKTKTSAEYGAAIEMITPTKQRKLILLSHLLQSEYQTEAVRIDIVTVDNAEDQPLLKHHKGLIEFHG